LVNSSGYGKISEPANDRSSLAGSNHNDIEETEIIVMADGYVITCQGLSPATALHLTPVLLRVALNSPMKA
jgi:hypothetical protein